MKRLKLIASLLAAALLCGCATSYVHTEFTPELKADGKEPVAVVVVENYGYYLFGFLPLFAGNPDKANANTLAVFEDTVTIENNQEMIIAEIDKLNTPYTITHMRDSVDWTGSFSLWIVWKQVLTSNAMVVKAAAPANGHAPSATHTSAADSHPENK